jgi:hypothetical protein
MENNIAIERQRLRIRVDGVIGAVEALYDTIDGLQDHQVKMLMPLMDVATKAIDDVANELTTVLLSTSQSRLDSWRGGKV